MKQFYLKFLSILLLVFSNNLLGQTPSTMGFGSSTVVLANSTNPSADQSVNPLLNNFDISGTSSANIFLAFALNGNDAGTDVIGGPGDAVLGWIGNASSSVSSGTLSTDNGGEIGITSMQFAYKQALGGSVVNFTFTGKKDGMTVGTLVLTSPLHNSLINLDFTSPTTGFFNNIDELVITPSSPLFGGFSIDDMVVALANTCTNPTVPTVTASTNPVCSGNTTTLNIAGTLNDATQWSIYTGSCGGTLLGTTTSSTYTTAALSANTTFYVRGEGGCVTPGVCGTLTVNVTNILLTPLSQTNVSCNLGSNGAATVNAPTGGTGPYTYNWTPGNPPGDGTTSVTGLTAGTWTCTTTDANGCTAARSFTLTQPSAITSSISAQSNVSCFGGSNGSATVAVSGGNPGYTYSWAPAGGTAATATGLTAGTYTCTITDANGCTKTQSATITQPTAIALTPSSQTNIACNGGATGAAAVNTPTGGTAPYTYNWTPGNPSGDGTTSVTGLSAGTWTCTTTDANGCSASQSFTVTQPTAITSSISTQTNVSCNAGSDGSATVAVSGGAGAYTYSWAPTGGTAAAATGLEAGLYTCTITDANGCTKTQSATITHPSAIATSISSQTNVSCNAGSDGSATVAVSGGTTPYTYSWSPSGGTAATATGLAAGNYTCTITDGNGCTKTQSVTLTQPSTAVVASVTVNNNVSCNGLSDGSATASGSGGIAPYTYLWSNGMNTATANGLAALTYNIWVTDANGCTKMTTVTITQPAAIDNTVSQSGGILTANQAGASYQWYTCPNSLIAGATAQSYTPSTVGDYKVAITVGSCSVESACETVTTLGTNTFENNLTFSIYPNPSNGLLNIKTNIDGDFIIANQLGQTVKSLKVNAGIENTINVENLAEGIYFIKGTNGTQVSSQRLIIKK